MAAALIRPALRLTAALSGPLKRLFLSSVPSPPSASASVVEEDLERLGRTLERIQAVLADAEERQIEDPSVRLWLHEIRGLAQHAEDVLDEVEYAELRQKVQLAIQADMGKPTQQGGAPPLPAGPLENPSFRDFLVSRIGNIRKKSEEIAASRDDLQLREEDGARRRAAAPARPPAAAYVDKLCAFGRGGDVEEVVGMLSSSDCHDGDDEAVSVVAIVGADGVGKTTLAQLVFHDQRVERHFEVRSWVWASQDFDVVRLTREMVEAVAGVSCDLDELSSLQEILDEHLAGKRVLLVLDDVWNESQSYWEALHVSLLGAAEGSRILVTTPSTKAARVSGAPPSQRHHLQGLAEEASWSLFCHHAFGGQEQLPQTFQGLVEMGKEICRRCRGFPLAVRTTGELLRGETDEQMWEEVLARETWDLEEDGGKALSTLQLGYHHLPAELKPCFAYCAALPRDCKFGKDQLVRLWIAQGLVLPTERKQTEEVAGEYFEELLRRSFFQQKPDHRNTSRRFVMHDPIHSLAQSVWGGESFTGEEPAGCKISRRHCHSTVICSKLEALSPCDASYDPTALRTLILKCIVKEGLDPLRLHYLLQKISRLPDSIGFGSSSYVRVLDLSDNNIFELPDSIGNLKLLRYLALNGTKIRRLPEAIGDLHILQTLELRHCYCLAELPRCTGYLISLRHLDLYCSVKLSRMPLGVGKLTGIQTLSIFAVGKEDGPPGEEGSKVAGIGELADLNDLRGELHILGLQNVLYGKFDASGAKMARKEQLERLHLDWTGEDSFPPDLATERDQDVLESLRPHSNIRELKISQYKGHGFPSWMGSHAFAKLGKVTLIGCRQCESVSPLGQLPALKSLDVHKMDGVRRVGREFFCNGGVLVQAMFPSLEALGLHDMAEWEEWLCWAEGGSEFPRLRRLSVRGCPKLASLSLHNLRALTSLEVRACAELACIDCFGSCALVGRQEGHLACLEKVELVECPRLGIPPGQQPSSVLGRLHISRCPCHRKRGYAEE